PWPGGMEVQPDVAVDPFAAWPGHRQSKGGRHDAGDRDAAAVERDRPSDDRAIGAEPLPQSVRDDRTTVVVEPSAKEGRRAEVLRERSCDRDDADVPRLA